MATYSTSEKTRNAFIVATGELAAEMGFYDISIRAIAERAGENISGIHYHFGSKEKLFEEVVRTATKELREKPILEIVERRKDELDSPKGQSQILKAMINRSINVSFNPDNPWWYSKIIYQVLQSKNPLQKLIKKEVVDPYFKALKVFIKRVKPEFSKQEILLYTNIIQGSIIIHTHNLEEGLLDSGRKHSSQYLRQLEEITVRQNLFLLDLPLS